VDVSIGGEVTALDASVSGNGQVTFDELGNRTYALTLDGEVSSGLAGPMLRNLPPDLRAQLPGGISDLDPNIAEATGGAGLEVKTDRHNEIQEISVSIKGSAGQGSGISTSALSGQSTSGESVEVKLTLDRQDIEALGPDARPALEALTRNRPDEAARLLARALDQADISVDRRHYTTVSGNASVERGPEGVSGGGEVTIESAR
jgi:hypothetical protein